MPDRNPQTRQGRKRQEPLPEQLVPTVRYAPPTVPLLGVSTANGTALSRLSTAFEHVARRANMARVWPSPRPRPATARTV